MKLIFFSIIAFSMIGLIFPSGFSSTYVHESDYPFSIQYPSDWYIFEFPEDEGSGISLDSDRTGRNGFYINLWCSESRGDDCGQASADYQELEYLIEDEKYFCENANFKEDHVRCVSLEILDGFAHQLDGYRAFTIVVGYTLLHDGKNPYYPDTKSGKFDGVGTTTYVLVGNDIWLIVSSNDVDKFDQMETENILSTFMLNNIYAQEDIFTPPSWFENLINAIVSLFGWNTPTDTTSSVIIETEDDFFDDPNIDWDNPIIIELDPCSLYEC